MKTQLKSILLTLTLLLVGSLGLYRSVSLSSARIIDQIVAVVNEDVITLSDLQPMLAPLQAKLQSISDPLKQQEILKEQVNQALEMLIDNTLILQKARNSGLTASPEEIEQYTGYIQQQQGISAEEFNQRLEAEGMSIEAFQNQIKERIISQKVIAQSRGPSTRVSPKEVKQSYQDYLTEERIVKQVEGYQIFLKVSSKDAVDEVAVRQKATELLNRLKMGESFQDLARQYSQGPAAQRGGYFGLISRQSGLPRKLEDAFFELGVGEFGGPLRTSFGYHIILTSKRVENKPASFEEMKPQLEAQLQQKKFQEELKKMVAELREEAVIERRLPQFF